MSSLNIIKKYPELLELAYLSEREREHDLHAIFKRDIEDNCQFSFRGWRIYPLKSATLLKSQSVAAQTAKNAIFLVWTDFLPCVG